jgi:MFS transporter, UMF1 family
VSAHDGTVEPTPGLAAGTQPALLTAPVVSWALYDFANTIFSYAVVTRYFNEWVIEQRGAPDWHAGLMSFLVAVALVVALPLSGAMADRLGRRKPFLVAFTLLSVAATASLALAGSTIEALLLGGVAIFGFQAALVHYDPLLADVAPERARARVSGLGVGLGYVGVLVALPVLALVVGDGDYRRAFAPTAAMFLVCALPCFVLVRERARPRTAGSGSRLVRSALAELAGTVRTARRYTDVWRFLLARFLYVDAIGTVIMFMTVYANRVADLSEAGKSALLGLSIAFAAAGAFVAGRVVERTGPKRVLVGVLGLLVVTMLVTAADGSARSLWVAGPIIGIVLGSVWTSDRVFMLRLSPARLRGEFFGLYGLVGKLSSGFGPLVLWGGTVLVLKDVLGAADEAAASRVATVVLAFAALGGLLLLRRLSDAPRPWSAD